MQLEKIISISGKPGLFYPSNAIKIRFYRRRYFYRKKKQSISNTSQVSLLDNIAIYTFDQEVPLFEVMKNIAENLTIKKPLIHKSSENELKSFMSSVLPNYDVDRVYGSDIKKLVQWYNFITKSRIY